jgi:hypothetical protein
LQEAEDILTQYKMIAMRSHLSLMLKFVMDVRSASLSLLKEKTGIWIVRTQKHLQDFVGPYLNYYDSIIVAGQCGRLMSRLRKMEAIEFDKLKVLASDIGIQPSVLKGVIIPTIEKTGSISTIKDNTGSVSRIEERIPITEEIFPLVTETWESLEPNEIESVTIESQELCSEIPCVEGILKERLNTAGYSQKSIDSALSLQLNCGILNNIGESQSPLVYSEYVWGSVMKHGGKWMMQLTSEQQEEVRSLVDRINNYQGLPMDFIQSTPTTIAAKKAGLIRVCKVNTGTSAERDFVFTPSIGQIFSDDTDEVKTFLACIRFGQGYSQISKIVNPLSIIDALLDESRGTVGPATAIGTDYVLLEKAGIVKVIRSSNYPGRYYMTLIKDDTARRAREVLTQGTVSGLDDSKLESLLSPNTLTNPEQNRLKMGTIPPRAKFAEEALFKVMRREKL